MYVSFTVHFPLKNVGSLDHRALPLYGPQTTRCSPRRAGRFWRSAGGGEAACYTWDYWTAIGRSDNLFYCCTQTEDITHPVKECTPDCLRHVK